MRNLALYDAASALFWDGKAPPKVRLLGRTPKYSRSWRPVLLEFPTQVTERVASSRLADYACLHSFRPDLPDIRVVEVSWTVTTREAEVEGLDQAIIVSRLRAHCPTTLVTDFSKLARKGFTTLPTHAVKRAVGIGKRVLDEYCPSVVHGSYYSFVNEVDAVAVRLLSDVTIVDLTSTMKV